jgi:thymidine phosphorylase
MRKIGDPVNKGDAILVLHAAKPSQLDDAVALAKASITIGDDRITPPQLIMDTILPESDKRHD